MFSCLLISVVMFMFATIQCLGSRSDKQVGGNLDWSIQFYNIHILASLVKCKDCYLATEVSMYGNVEETLL